MSPRSSSQPVQDQCTKLRANVLCNSTSQALDILGVVADAGLAGSAISGFEELKRQLPTTDVLIMDLMLPEVDGIEIIRYLGDQVQQPELIITSNLDSRIIDAVKRLALSKGITIRSSLSLPVKFEDLKSALIKPKNSDIAASNRRLLVTDPMQIRRGLANDEFTLVFQPKIDVTSLALVSVESLIRWQHPDYGLLGPDAFIGLAEKTGLISPLTEVVVEKSFKNAAQWSDAGMPLKVAINVSGASLADLRLPDRLVKMAKKHQLPPDRVVVEITETWVTRNWIDALDILTRLRMKGFNLSIDDFGTGYSSLLKLKQIPFTELKLDQSIIRGASKDEDSRNIVESSIELGHKLGLHLVAEGVELQDDWDLISDLGCNEGQGFFIARPMKSQDLPDWLNRWNLSLGL